MNTAHTKGWSHPPDLHDTYLALQRRCWNGQGQYSEFGKWHAEFEQLMDEKYIPHFHFIDPFRFVQWLFDVDSTPQEARELFTIASSEAEARAAEALEVTA